jgi:hypothetical protein
LVRGTKPCALRDWLITTAPAKDRIAIIRAMVSLLKKAPIGSNKVRLGVTVTRLRVTAIVHSIDFALIVTAAFAWPDFSPRSGAAGRHETSMGASP